MKSGTNALADPAPPLRCNWQAVAVTLARFGRYTWIERDNYHILGQITKVLQAPQTVDLKQLPPKPKSMQADGQRKELQRITADNKRLCAATPNVTTAFLL